MFTDWDGGSSISDPEAPAMTLLSMVLSSQRHLLGQAQGELGVGSG